MKLDVIDLTRDLIAIESESRHTNTPIADYLASLLNGLDFSLERLTYIDENGLEKVNLVAKKGEGTDGLGFFSHSDTVPGNPDGWEPFQPHIKDGRLIGRGSCDMKGPLAATIVAAANIDASSLKHPLYIVIAADEEVGYKGALNIIAESQTMKAGWPKFGVIPEPTNMVPMYAHKGRSRLWVTAHGKAAHTSTDRGISANFLIAPFMAEMAELVPLFKSDERFMNHEFDPPTNGFNLIINDGNCATNVTAAKTTCTIDIRTMPDDNREEALGLMRRSAKKYGLSVEGHAFDPFYISPDSEMIDLALKATGCPQAQTVPFGTEAAVYKDYFQPVILGPGDIAQAHTVGEYIEIEALHQAVNVYRQMIDLACL
ncbi:MAG: M20/M25/M40 family metallo-hydrolase [Chloroflexota bacterium]